MPTIVGQIAAVVWLINTPISPTVPAQALSAQAAPTADVIGQLIDQVPSDSAHDQADFHMLASLYHGGGRGIRPRDSLGCPTVAMRTLAVDPNRIPRHSIVFIKETVGLPMPDGRVHDGYWYASDIGGAIKGDRLDLFTGNGAGSMRPFVGINMSHVSVTKVGTFEGCPSSGDARVAAN